MPILQGLGGFLALLVILVVWFSLLLTMNLLFYRPCVVQTPRKSYLELVFQEVVISKLISII